MEFLNPYQLPGLAYMLLWALDNGLQTILHQVKKSEFSSPNSLSVKESQSMGKQMNLKSIQPSSPIGSLR